jgi:hypothetical protein
MQNIRDDLLAKSVKDKISVLEKEGAIKPDPIFTIDPTAHVGRYPFKSTFTVFILLTAFVVVVGYFTDNLKVTEYIQGSVIAVIGLSLVFFIIGIVFKSLRHRE